MDFTDAANVGKEYNGFYLLKVEEIPDYKAKGVYLRHKRTGLEVYHVVKDDKENLFAFAFRTVAKDNFGTAHILEHSTLCGTEKYPLKEPFNNLLSQSLYTFLNALTYPDKTVYPGASVVKADYFNIMDVYADSVFFPKLQHETFLQEGHRLEMDEKGQLSIQGVVYNEMKGNYSSFAPIAFQNQIKAMFPDSYPSFDSGGDPLEIPDLSYEQFLDFHQKFYNPDNCILFLYGDIPTQEQLDFLNERFMPRIEKKYNCTKDILHYDSKLPLVKSEIKELMKLNKNTSSKEIRNIAPETGATGNMVTVNWYTGEADIEKIFLSEVLCGNDSSPVSKALKDSSLGDEENCGNFGQFNEEIFSFGLWGVKKGNENKVFDLIYKVLNDLYHNGINQNDIDSAVMGIDFALREVNRYMGPYSIQIMEKALKGWCNGKECSSQLNPITSFEKIKEKIRNDKDYTKNLIKKYFLDNPVQIKFICEPSKKYFENRKAAEKELITKLEENLDKETLRKDLDELHAYQQHIETPEEAKCIPFVRKNELDADIVKSTVDLEFLTGADGSKVPFFVSDEDTNGLFYLDVLFPFDRIDVKNYKYISFLSQVLTNMGWGGKKWNECISESACVMGDIWGRVTTGTVSQVPECIEQAEKYKEYNFCGRNWIGLTCKALTEKVEPTLKMFSEIITKMDFNDKKRFKSLVQENYSDKKSSVVSMGRDYVLKRSRAVFTKNHAIQEILWGVTQLNTTKEYKKSSAGKMLKLFEKIYTSCRKSGAILHITADTDSLKKIKPYMNDFVKASQITKLLPVNKVELEDYIQLITKSKNISDYKNTEYIKLHSQTGYAAVSIPASPYLTKEAAAEHIFTSWFSNHSLWDKFRTTGGAYGVASYVDSCEKICSMFTYRDPFPQKAKEIYLQVLKEISDFEIPEEDVEKTIVSEYGSAITPYSPKDMGKGAFESFIYANYGFKQRRVNDLLSVTAKDVNLASKRLYQNSQKETHSCVLCDKSVKVCGNFLELPL